LKGCPARQAGTGNIGDFHLNSGARLSRDG
jgi:hypothetical protein